MSILHLVFVVMRSAYQTERPLPTKYVAPKSGYITVQLILSDTIQCRLSVLRHFAHCDAMHDSRLLKILVQRLAEAPVSVRHAICVLEGDHQAIGDVGRIQRLTIPQVGPPRYNRNEAAYNGTTARLRRGRGRSQPSSGCPRRYERKAPCVQQDDVPLRRNIVNRWKS